MSSSTRVRRTASAPAARPRRKVHAPAAQPPVTSADTSGKIAGSISDELRHAWVAEAAYFIAERRGFRGGSPEDDWCQAEVEIAQLLAVTRH